MKGTAETIVSNSVMLSATELLSRLLSLVLIMAVARTLGPEQTGIYAFCVTVVILLSVVLNFGSDQFIKREIGRDASGIRSMMINVAMLKCLLFIVTAGVVALASFYTIHDEVKRTVLLVMTLSLFFQSHTASAYSFFRALLRPRYESLCGIGFRIGNTVFGLAALRAGYEIRTLAMVETVMSILVFAVMLLLLPGITRGAPAPAAVSLSGVLRLVLKSWRLALLQATQSLFYAIDMLLLPLRADNLAAGLYGAALRFSGAFMMIPNAIASSMLPVLSHASKERPDEYGSFVEKYIKYHVLIGAGISCMLCCFAHEIVLLIYGDRFLGSIPVLQIMAVTVFLIFINYPLSNAMVSQDRESASIILFAVIGLLAALLNFMIIPSLRETGAAACMALAQLVLIIFQYRFLQGQKRMKLPIIRLTAGPAVVCGVMFAASLAAEPLHLWLPLKIAATGALFCAGLFATRSLNMAEVRMFGELLFKRKKAVLP